MNEPRGLLLAMLDADVEDELEFNRWYDTEHIRERLECPGFISARRFLAVEGKPRYLTIYELTEPAAVHTPEYLALSSQQSEVSKNMLSRFRGLVRNIYVEIGETRFAEH